MIEILAQSNANAADDNVGTLIWIVVMIWVFGGFSWLGARYHHMSQAMRTRKEEARRHELDLKRIELEIAQGKTSGETVTAASPVPGLCRHRKAVPVRSNEGEVLSWLCLGCDEQLPKTFSIYEEDL